MPNIDDTSTWGTIRPTDGRIAVPVAECRHLRPQSGEFRNDSSRLSVNYLIPFLFSPDAGDVFCGRHYVAGVGTPYLSRQIPQARRRFVNSTNSVWLYATHCRQYQPFGAPAVAIKDFFYGDTVYQLAMINVVYESLTYEVKSDADCLVGGIPSDIDAAGYPQRYIFYTSRASNVALAVPTGQLKYNDGAGTNVTSSQILPQPSRQITLVWHYVPTAALRTKFLNRTATATTLDDAVGRVNSDTFMGARKGTLRVVGVDPRPVRGAFGDRYWDVTIILEHIDLGNSNDLVPVAIGHQHLPKYDPPNSIKWYEATMTGSTNFNNMINFINLHNWIAIRDMFKPPP